MKGLAKLGPGAENVGIVERDEPEVCAGHVVIAVRTAGICGTDIHIVDDEFRSWPPVTMGHEICGVVEQIGDGVEGRAFRPRRLGNVLLDVRRLRLLPLRPREPLPRTPLDRIRQRRGVRTAAARPGEGSAPGAGVADRRGRSADRAARLRLQLPARPACRLSRRRRARRRPRPDRVAHRSGRQGVRR